MSLAQHVTETEGIDREPVEHEEDSAWRRLSYDAFAPVELDLREQEPEPHIPAYRVSPARRIAQIAFAVTACCLASGIVFGFASLKPVLVAEGVYRDQCPLDDGSTTSNPYPFIAASEDEELGYQTPCAEQDLRLNLFFISASITTNVSSLFAGAALDRLGRRICYIASSVFLTAGCLLMGFAFAIPEFDGYIMANMFLGLGGTFLFVPSFQLANAFPKHAGLVVALITGAFDASAAVFLVYRLLWEASDGSFHPWQFFFAFLVVPIAILVAEWTLMPANAYKTTHELEDKLEKVQDPALSAPESSDEDSLNDAEIDLSQSQRRESKLHQIEEIVGDTTEREERARAVEKRHVVSGIWGVLHGLPAHAQMLTPWFVLLLLLTVLQMLRMNYFIATLRSQYRFMLQSEDDAEAINHFFDVALPVGGIVTTPFIGLLLNNISVAGSLAVLTVFITLIGILNCLPYLWAGYATVICFVIFRPLYYSAMSDYATKVFGFATFGRVYGMIICLSGLVQFAQSGLDALTHGPLEGDPTSINVFMGIAGCVLGIVLTVFVYVKSREYQVEQELECSPSERLALIQEHPEEYGALHG